MYDSHIYCREFKTILDYIKDCIHGDVEDYDVEKLSNYVQELYKDGEMTSSQYDYLMAHINEL